MSVGFTEAPDTNRSAGPHSFIVVGAHEVSRVHLPPVRPVVGIF